MIDDLNSEDSSKLSSGLDKGKELEVSGANNKTSTYDTPKLLVDAMKANLSFSKKVDSIASIKHLLPSTTFSASSSTFNLGSIEASSSHDPKKDLTYSKRPRTWSKSAKDRKSKSLKALDSVSEVNGELRDCPAYPARARITLTGLGTRDGRFGYPEVMGSGTRDDRFGYPEVMGSGTRDDRFGYPEVMGSGSRDDRFGYPEVIGSGSRDDRFGYPEVTVRVPRADWQGRVPEPMGRIPEPTDGIPELSDRVPRADLVRYPELKYEDDPRYVQFLFQTEVDLVAVLRKGPWLFNQWFIALQRWMDFPDEEFITFIDIWVQVRGIPLPYVSELTVRFIASTLGHVVDLDFNEATTIQIVFIRVKIRFGISDRLRFFRRVRFESGEGAMISFEYEKLRRICTNCCRINHQVSHCPYLAPPDIPDEILDVPDNPVGEEERRTKSHNLSEDSSSSFSSDISSYSPISQPPRPPTPMPNLEEFLAANPMQRFPGSSSSSHPISLDSTSMQDFKAKSSMKLEKTLKERKARTSLMMMIEIPVNAGRTMV
ncbi:Zinc knuckle CX2CX4HX4C [Arabidopsis thaliana x Arabidopsis arenosa]|uniref:Zinc knuckle CX2CX4HX4C n=1 Tax=Arabidopsis thaliana x Arabidopsis arenosa TaxID=1240361 RepID=A0A8T2A6U5_9BRAS|nr:Zinc knuckle CX2CX4HX4C [Arabidopsis thaliana x Arabidopsis arenosa]